MTIAYVVYEYNYDDSMVHYVASSKKLANQWIDKYCYKKSDKHKCNFVIIEKLIDE